VVAEAPVRRRLAALAAFKPPSREVWAGLPPGPRGKPLVGCALDYMRDPLGTLTRAHRAYGRTLTLSWFGYPLVLLIGPEGNRLVLSEQPGAFLWRPALYSLIPLLGEGLLVTDGDLHDRLRRLVLPVFQRGRVDSYVPIMWDYATQFFARWYPGQVFDVDAAMRALTLQIAGRIIFGVDLQRDRAELMHGFRGTADYSRLQWPFNLFRLNLPFTAWGQFVRARQQLDRFLYRLIDEKSAATSSAASRDDALSALLDARDEDGSRLSRRQVRDQVLTLLAAGHDTTAHALTWTLYLLARHPEALSRVVAEQREVLGDTAPTPDSLRQLVYLEMVAKEALRLYPPAWAGARVAATDIHYQGYRIPAGTSVVYSQWLSHRLPDIFHDPLAFRPERFDPEQGEEHPSFAYVPFGGGARLCLGMTFAIQEIKVVLSALLARWRLTLEPGQHVVPRPVVTLVPREPIRMRTEAA
jgi:cytochrome P450